MSGNWSSAVYDPSSAAIYATKWSKGSETYPRGELLKLDRSGRVLGVPLVRCDPPEAGCATAMPRLRLAHFSPQRSLALVSFATWGREVTAHDGAGRLLWTYSAKEGVDDVWVGNLSGAFGNEGDSVVVGYNGFGDLVVLNENGQVRLRDTNGGNWHDVAGGTIGPGGATEILVNTNGAVRCYHPPGWNWEEIRPIGFRAAFVGVALTPDLRRPTIVVTNEKREVFGLERSGEVRWNSTLPPCHVSYDNANDGAEAPGRPWMAMNLSDGRVVVYNLATGALIASTTVGDRFDVGSVAWIPDAGPNGPLLLIASRRGLSACVVREVVKE